MRRRGFALVACQVALVVYQLEEAKKSRSQGCFHGRIPFCQGNWNETDIDPCWRGKPIPRSPPYRRWRFAKALRWLKGGPGFMAGLHGPRQAENSAPPAQLIHHPLHQEGIDPRRIFCVQFGEISI
jgi:hypothetical protein